MSTISLEIPIFERLAAFSNYFRNNHADQTTQRSMKIEPPSPSPFPQGERVRVRGKAENLNTSEVSEAMKEASQNYTTLEDEWLPSVCRMCFYGQCAIVAHRVNGVITKIEGNPNAPHNLGRLCARGNAAIMDLYDPYRVKVPLKRTNPDRGLDVDPKWMEISWEQALDTVAERLKVIRAEDPRQLFFSHGNIDDTHGIMLAWKAVFGCHPHQWYGGTGSCGSSEHAISMMTHHAFISPYDHDYTEYLILAGTLLGFGTWGAGATSTCQRTADDRVNRGLKVVVIEPRCSEAASKANEWIPILPGTDLALFLSMLHVMLHELNKYDRDFVKRHSNGPYLIKPDGFYMRDENTGKPFIWDSIDLEAKVYDDPTIKDYALEGTYRIRGTICRPAFQLLKDAVEPYTPEWSSEITTVPSETTRRITKEFVDAAKIGATITIDGIQFPYRPAVITGYQGMQKHRNGMFACMAYNLLNLLIGNPHVPGGVVSMDMSKTGWAPDPYAFPPRDGLLAYIPYAEMKFPPGIDLHECFPLTLDTSWWMSFTLTDPQMRKKFKIPYDVKAMITYYTNPFRNMGNPRLTEKAYKSIPFHVAISVWIDEPTLFADVVLPESHYLERMNLQLYWKWHLRSFGWMLRQPVLEPLYNTKNAIDIIIELAERVGMLYGPGGFNDIYNNIFLAGIYRAQYPSRLDINRKYTFEEITDITAKAVCGPERDLNWFKKHGLWMWDVPTQEHYRFPPHRGVRVPIYFEYIKAVGEELKGKMKEGLGIDWDVSEYSPLPRWLPDPEHRSELWPEDYDLYLMNYKTPYNTFGSTASNAWLSEISQLDPYIMKVWINAETAERKGIKDGEEVWIESKIDKVLGQARVSQCVHPQVVAIGGGFGGWATNPHSKKGINYARLMPLEPAMINPVLCNNDYCTRVKVYKSEE